MHVIAVSHNRLDSSTHAVANDNFPKNAVQMLSNLILHAGRVS